MGATVVPETGQHIRQLKGLPLMHEQSASNQPGSQSSTSTKELYYSDELYAPEALFSSWLNLSFFSVTTALLFYHMTIAKSLEADPRVAAFLAISLMTISCAYVFYSMGPYIQRMDHLQAQCKALKECSDEQTESIRRHKVIYKWLGYGTIGVEIIIALLIVFKTRRLLT